MEEEKKTVAPVKTAVKAFSLASSLPALAALLPAQYAHIVYYAAIVIAAAAMAATQIPAPTNPSSKLHWLYSILSFLARNSGEAANAVTALKPKK